MDREATVKEILTVQIEGQREVSRKFEYYNLDAFLQFNEYEVLQNAGKISHQVAEALAEGEYNKYRVIQDQQFESDFDKTIKELERRS